jgi:hypothetical protein
MVVIFKTREISRGACKLTRTPTLIKKKEKEKERERDTTKMLQTTISYFPRSA